jgi:hypothetical protein
MAYRDVSAGMPVSVIRGTCFHICALMMDTFGIRMVSIRKVPTGAGFGFLGFSGWKLN